MKQDHENLAEPAISRELILQHLDHMLGSDPFAGSDRLRRLLRHVVEQTLNGGGNGLKEYAIGVDVFDRNPDYNPQLDSTVRVHAGKLRDKIREYYLTAGRDSAIRIELPKGSYVPIFRMQEPAAPRVEAGAVSAQVPDPGDVHGHLEDQIPAVSRPKSWRSAAWTGAVLIFIAVAAVSIAHYRMAPRTSGIALTFTIPDPGIASAFPLFDVPAVSPDGKQVVFSAAGSDGQRRLVLRRMDDLEMRPLAGTEGGYAAFWSPDSRHIAFFADNHLKRIPVSGGPAHVLCEAALGWGGTWNQEGILLFGSGRQGATIRRVTAGGGASLAITALDRMRGDESHTWPQFLPDGKHFIVLVTTSRPEHEGIYTGSLGDTRLSFVTRTQARGIYADAGYLLVTRGQALIAAPFDARGRHIGEETIEVVPHVQTAIYNPGSGYIRVGMYSAGGNTLVYRSDSGAKGNSLRWFSRDGEEPKQIGDSGDYTGPAFSPDGKVLAFARLDAGTHRRDIWLYDLRRSSASRFTFDPGDDMNPTWSPDGTRLAFTSDRKGVRDIYLKSSTAMAPEEILLESSWEKNVEDWSPDGRYILYNEVRPGHERELWAVSVQDHHTFPVIVASKPVRKGVFSPSGRYLAYVSGESGQDEVYVQTFPSSTGKWQISTRGGTDPRWSQDGKELFYAADNAFLAVSVESFDGSFATGSPHELFRLLPVAMGRNRCDVSRDARHFVCTTRNESPESSGLRVISNWPAGLR